MSRTRRVLYLCFSHLVTGWPVREQAFHTEGSFLSAEFVLELFLSRKFLRKDTFLNILRCPSEVTNAIFTSVFTEQSIIRYLGDRDPAQNTAFLSFTDMGRELRKAGNVQPSGQEQG